MTLLRRTATTAVAAFAVVLAVPAVGADAASSGRHFETLSSVSGGKIQACRIPTKASKPVIIKLRVDATKATGKVNGLGQATKDGNPVGKAWKSGWVKQGTKSATGTVRVPRGAAYQLMAGIGAGQMGDGGSWRTKDIRLCR
jgi:hypothetical protein